MPCFKFFPFIKIETFIIDGKEYLFKVDQVGAEIVKTEYSDGEIESIDYDTRVWFLSQLSDQSSRGFACIYLIVQPQTRTGLIDGVTNKYYCTGRKIGERIDLFSGRGQGYILMMALLENLLMIILKMECLI